METEILDGSFATLSLPDGRELKLEVMKPTLGKEVVVDVRSLHATAKVLTFDPGFNSTASCRSAITYIDGDEGLCLYRGHAVHELVETSNYLDVCYLLLYGHLPGDVSRAAFYKEIKNEMLVHEQLKVFVQGFIHGSHPMSILASVISAMASFHADPMSANHLDDPEQRELACIRLIAKLPTIVAMIFKVTNGQPIVYPQANLSYAKNFINMMFGTPIEPYVIDPVKAKVIDAFLIIHADHEQNASTSTVRTAGSSLANPFACIAAGVTSLWGRAHGGANEAVIRMLKDISDESNIDHFIQQVKDKKIRLMGFGHRIYRNYDPRATIMRKLCYELFESTGKKDVLFDIAMKLEKVALKDDYFVSRKLYPNVDFYSGILMRGLGIPEEMFTVLFALGRVVGWLSHWKEMVEEKQLKISRPRQLYLGLERQSPNLTTKKEEQHEKNTYGPTKEADEAHADAPHQPFHRVQAKVIQKREPMIGRVDYDFDVWGEGVVAPAAQHVSDFSTV